MASAEDAVLFLGFFLSSILHLHGFDDGQGLVLPDFFLFRDIDLNDLARHRRRHHRQPLVGRVLTGPEAFRFIGRLPDHNPAAVDENVGILVIPG